jgi:hypothetical protein
MKVRRNHAYPVTEQLTLWGDREIKIATLTHLRARDKTAKENLQIPDRVMQPIWIG